MGRKSKGRTDEEKKQLARESARWSMQKRRAQQQAARTRQPQREKSGILRKQKDREAHRRTRALKKLKNEVYLEEQIVHESKPRDQQFRLLEDPRCTALQRRFQDYVRNNAETKFLTIMNKLALFIFEAGVPAINWHGSCCSTVSQEETDYFIFTEKRQEQWLAKKGNLKKVAVIRHTADREAKGRHSMISEFWNDAQRLLQRSPKAKVDVQDFSQASPITRHLLVAEAYRRWIKPNNEPINLLNLSSPPDQTRLSGIRKHFTFLDKAVQDAEAMTNGLGKQTTSTTDIRGCLNFRILGQSGAISGWHMDNMGAWTWVRLEDDGSDNDESVVKYWPIARIEHLSPEDQATALADFAQNGPLWRPKPPVRIIILSLVKGDTLLMPPGTIHAPITLTDCLFSGGMCIHPLYLNKSLQIWEHLLNNPCCTNEDLPQQVETILAAMCALVRSSPDEYGTALQELPCTCAIKKKKTTTKKQCGEHCECADARKGVLDYAILVR